MIVGGCDHAVGQEPPAGRLKSSRIGPENDSRKLGWWIINGVDKSRNQSDYMACASGKIRAATHLSS